MNIINNGRPVNSKMIMPNITKAGTIINHILWFYAKTEYVSPGQLNEILDNYDKVYCLENKNTISSTEKLKKLGAAAFKWKYKKKKNETKGETKVRICCSKYDKKENTLTLTKYTNTKSTEDFPPWLAFETMNRLYELEHGISFESRISSLPDTLHKNRTCCPKPIDWCDRKFSVEFADDDICLTVNKADVSFAYGSELCSNKLPDLRSYVEKIGEVEPTEEYPFAFYPDSNNMAVYGEGNTFDWMKDKYAVSARKAIKLAENTKTILFKSTDYQMGNIITELYKGRKKKPENKAIVNMTIGMLDREDLDDYNTIIAWPIRAVIMFRCNQRILNYCHILENIGCVPVLINTDSISWLHNSDTTGFEEVGAVREKALGKLIIEYEDCQMYIASVKTYQILDGEHVITKWAGVRKEVSSELPFGAICRTDVRMLMDKIARDCLFCWDEKRFRFITANGDLYKDITKEDIQKWELQVKEML